MSWISGSNRYASSTTILHQIGQKQKRFCTISTSLIRYVSLGRELATLVANPSLWISKSVKRPIQLRTRARSLCHVDASRKLVLLFCFPVCQGRYFEYVGSRATNSVNLSCDLWKLWGVRFLGFCIAILCIISPAGRARRDLYRGGISIVLAIPSVDHSIFSRSIPTYRKRAQLYDLKIRKV